MIIVTGGAGFIGSNIVLGLNQMGYQDIMVVDDLTEGKKFTNLQNCVISDYVDKDDFYDIIAHNESLPNIEAIFHQGACSQTTQWDGKYMMDNNFTYSKALFHYCLNHKIPFYYASSAAVYGASTDFKEHVGHEKPLNVYGYSKYLFDQYVIKNYDNASTPVAGFRYFNVYGPHEQHKGSMCSVAYHLNNQLMETGQVKLFEGCDGYQDGEQQRDFIYVDDVVKVNLWFLKHQKSGIYNLGTGRAQTFNDVARSVIDWHQKGSIAYVPFPEHLKGCYQSYTQADITRLRQAGFRDEFLTVEQGVKRYLDVINQGSRQPGEFQPQSTVA